MNIIGQFTKQSQSTPIRAPSAACTPLRHQPSLFHRLGRLVCQNHWAATLSNSNR